MNYILRRPAVGDNAGRIAEFMSDTKVVMKEDFPQEAPEYLFRWGSTASLPWDTKTINKSKAIHWAYDKRTSRKVFADAGDAPKTWLDFGDLLDHEPEYFSGLGADGSLIVRPEHHSKGIDMDLCNSLSEVYKATKKYPKYYISEMIKKEHEYRVYIVQGRVINCVEKIVYDKTVLAWGDTNASQFKYIEWSDWPMEVIKCALRCHEKTGLDFSAVDIMTLGDKAYCLEVNTAPEITPYVGKCYGQAFEWLVKNGKDALPVGPGNDFKSYIHPSRYAGALIGQG